MVVSIVYLSLTLSLRIYHLRKKYYNHKQQAKQKLNSINGIRARLFHSRKDINNSSFDSYYEQLQRIQIGSKAELTTASSVQIKKKVYVCMYVTGISPRINQSDCGQLCNNQSTRHFCR